MTLVLQGKSPQRQLALVAFFGAIMAATFLMPGSALGFGDDISGDDVRANDCSTDDSLCPPQVTKEFLSAIRGTSSWLVTVTTPAWSQHEGDWGVYKYDMLDEGAVTAFGGGVGVASESPGGGGVDV